MWLLNIKKTKNEQKTTKNIDNDFI